MSTRTCYVVEKVDEQGFVYHLNIRGTHREWYHDISEAIRFKTLEEALRECKPDNRVTEYFLPRLIRLESFDHAGKSTWKIAFD